MRLDKLSFSRNKKLRSWRNRFHNSTEKFNVEKLISRKILIYIRSIYLIFAIIFLIAKESYAQFYFFGRNKVRYENFNWKVIQSEHFEIYYDENFEEVAKIGSAIAEESYKDLCVKFEQNILTKIPLIFYNTSLHFQQTNIYPGLIPEGVGGFYEFLKGRVVIPYNGSIKDFKHVIKHELVHVFTLNKIYNVLKDRRISFNRFPPLWFVEGIAEYWSTEWDSKGETILRDAIENNYAVDLKNFWKISGSYLMYKQGQKFLEFVSSYYGEEKILRLLENIWMFEDFEENISFTLNESIEEINKKWIDYLKRGAYKFYYSTENHETFSKLISSVGYNFSPIIFKNEKETFIIYLANKDGYSSIYLQKIEKENLNLKNKAEIVIKGEKDESFESFYFMQNIFAKIDDDKFVFVSRSGASDAFYLYSFSQNKIIEKIAFKDVIAFDSPSFVGENKILFVGVDRKGYKDIYIYDLDQKKLDKITDDYYCDESPIYVASKNSILFVSDRNLTNEKKGKSIYEYDINEAKIKLLYESTAEIFNLKYSEKYNSLFYLIDEDGVQNIFKLKFDRNNDKNDNLLVSKISNFFTGVANFDLADDIIVYSAYSQGYFKIFGFKLNEDILNKSITHLITQADSSSYKIYDPIKLDITGKSKLYSLQKKYSIDFAQSQISVDPIFGTQGGAAIFLSDMLGDDQYYVYVYNTAEVQSEFLKSFNVAIARINLENRINYSYGIFHFSGRRYDIRDKDEFYYERSFGSSASLLYPLSRFKRFELGVTIANSDKQIVARVIERKALLVSTFISFVSDNSIWAFTGPIDGHRLRILAGYSKDVKNNNVDYFTGIIDYRQYFRLSFKSLLAFRNSLYYNDGKETRRFIAGGSWDLRGWRRWSLRGEKLWVSSLELRFPILDLAYLKFPVFDVSLPNFRGAFFFDIGSVWDKKYEQTIGALGYGFRFNLLNVVVLRYDIGKKIENNFSKFQNGWFYQFFFGWDF